ncbi:hypothetical protein EXN66_Car020949 [Channa argus]|uniref:Uncharacterized protein n=1 Tax=Channa argus TaxID=215402 RepID=A0A6G1QSR7_CHAAH|nr:hypothetical protein EXN66_Car020949 [Channa argus]
MPSAPPSLCHSFFTSAEKNASTRPASTTGTGLSWRGKIGRFAKFLSVCAPTRPTENNLDIKEGEICGE